MKFNYVLFGLLVGAIIGYFASPIGVEEILKGIRDDFVLLLILGLGALLLIALLFITYEWLVKTLLGTDKTTLNAIVQDLANAIGETTLFKDSASVQNLSKSLKTISGLYATWRLRLTIFQTIGLVVVALGGTLATFVMIRQNEIMELQNTAIKEQTIILGEQTTSLKIQTDSLKRQNELFETQNTSAKIALIVQSSNRYQQYGPLVASVLEQITQEVQTIRANRPQQFDACRQEADPLDQEAVQACRKIFTSQIKLSNTLVITINNLLSQLGPYAYLDNSSFSSTTNIKDLEIENNGLLFLSPEKGQILKALFFNDVDLIQFDGSDFSFADLRFTEFYQQGLFMPALETNCGPVTNTPAKLNRLKLTNADFFGSQFQNVKLPLGDNFNLNETNISNSIISLNSTNDALLPVGRISITDSVTELPNSIRNLDITLNHYRGAFFYPCLVLEAYETNEPDFPKINLTGLSINLGPNPWAIDGPAKPFPFLSDFMKSFESNSPLPVKVTSALFTSSERVNRSAHMPAMLSALDGIDRAYVTDFNERPNGIYLTITFK